MKRTLVGFCAVWAASLAMPPAEVDASSISLTATIRDFQQSHPDFQNFISNLAQGIVGTNLGGDGLPVYVATPPFGATTGQANFDQWYRDTAGVNLKTTITVVADETSMGSGIFKFTDNSFFPIDGQLFGNEGNSNNFHFTTEIHTEFTYQAGTNQVFSFTGDDDVWVFINGILAVDIGGVHGVLADAINLDTAGVAAALGLTDGGQFSLDLFHAERHTTQSNFSFTTFELIDVPPDPDPNGNGVVPEPASLSLLALGGLGLIGCRRRRRRLPETV